MFFFILSLSLFFQGHLFAQTMDSIDFMQGLVSSVYKTPITAYDVAIRIEAQFQSLPEKEKEQAELREQFYRENWGKGVIDTVDASLFREEARRFFIECSSKKTEEDMNDLPEDTKLQSFLVEYLQHRSHLELSPKKIKNAFRNYVRENCEQTLWKYRILSFSSDINEKDFFDLTSRISQEKNPDSLMKDKRFGPFCSLSIAYEIQSKSLTEEYRKELEMLTSSSFSGPIATKQGNFVFLFLEGKTSFPTKNFQEMSEELTINLLNQNMQKNFSELINELREFQEIS